jgi:hypothetical protein
MRTLSRTLFATAILFNVVIASFAQTSPKDAVETGAITGRVILKGDDEQPVPGIGIILMPSAPGRYARRPLARATTGADGFYRLANVPAGSYQLQILAPGYNPVGALATSGADVRRTINIEAGETIEHQDFALARGGVITGRVTDADGKPVIAEQLKLLAADRTPSGSVNVRPPYIFETDDRGVYRMYGLPAGRYLVCVGEEKGRAVSMALSGRNRTHTCHPNATDEAQAKIVEVSSGGEATGVDITLAPPAKTYEATGRMVDAERGLPMANLSYGFGALSADGKQINSRGWSGARTNAEGEFRFSNLRPGRYVVFVVTREGDVTNYYSEAVPFEIDDGNVSGVVVKVRRGATLRGVVSVEGTTDRDALAKLTQVDLHIRMVPADPRAGEINPGNASRLIIRPDGSFFVAGLPPGKAQVRLSTFSSPPGFRLLRVERGAVEQRGGIEIGDGEQVSDVRIRLAYGMTVLRGQVEVRRDGQPSQLPEGAQMYVRMRPVGGERSGRYNISTEVDSRGRFVFEGLIAGEYELVGHGWIRSPTGAQTGTGLPSARQTVSVPEKGEINVTLVYDLNAKPQGARP